MYDLQRASMWKRISAWLFDFIMLIIVVIGFAYILTTVFGYDSYVNKFTTSRSSYAETYGIDLDISEKEYNALSDADKENYNKADKAFASDKDVAYVYNMLINLAFIITTFSILLGFLLLEFLVPLLFKNGQTLGKKIFGVGVMREDGVKISSPLLFARAILGKCTLETMVPVLTVVMMIFGIMGFVGTIIIFGIALIEVIMMASTKTNSTIHDKISHTVTVDMASQMIFDTPEELLAYKKRIHAEEAEKKEY